MKRLLVTVPLIALLLAACASDSIGTTSGQSSVDAATEPTLGTTDSTMARVTTIGPPASLGPTTSECTGTTRPESGDIEADIVGSWIGVSIDAVLVWDFADDGTFRVIEPPNPSLPRGDISEEAYVAAGDQTLTLRGRTHVAEVRDGTLHLDGAAWLQAVDCTGFGFSDT